MNLEHFYNEEQLLYIAEGKFRKARWVALSDSTCQALQQYKHKRLQMLPRSPDSPFFINQRSRRLHHCAVNQAFRQLLKQCHIHHNKNGPRLHDIRHTFAVHRLLAWYRDGQDVNARLPWLATYMGHVDIHSTQVYLRAGNDVNMVSYWLGHADINTTHIYVEIDMEMKRQMLQKAGPPDVKKPLPWQKPNVLQWLNSIAKAPQLCVVNY